jgi:hypothetical protein
MCFGSQCILLNVPPPPNPYAPAPAPAPAPRPPRRPAAPSSGPSYQSVFTTPSGARLVQLQSEGGATCTCQEGFSCLNNGQCCASGSVCGAECCTNVQTCFFGQCCNVAAQCGNQCCPSSQLCVGGQCCADTQVCGSSCCPAGSTCVQGKW